MQKDERKCRERKRREVRASEAKGGGVDRRGGRGGQQDDTVGTMLTSGREVIGEQLSNPIVNREIMSLRQMIPAETLIAPLSERKMGTWTLFTDQIQNMISREDLNIIINIKVLRLIITQMKNAKPSPGECPSIRNNEENNCYMFNNVTSYYRS